MKQILITGHGLHRVDFTDTVPLPRDCSTCGGDCPSPEACLLPEAAPPVPSQQITGELWAGFIGAVLGMAALALYGHEFIRQFLNP